MKKERVKLLINGLIAGVCVLLFAYLMLNLIIVYPSSAFKVILSAVVGVAVTLILNSIIHETGHIIAGLICGLKVNSVQYLGLFIGKIKGKIKVKFKSADGEVGVTELIPKNSKNTYEKYVVSALGGLVASFILLAVQIIICLLSKSLVLYAGLGITFPITAYVFLINLFPVFENNDGHLVYTYLLGGDDRKICSNYYKAIALLYEGVEPSELEPSLLIDYQKEGQCSVGIRYLRYLAYLQSDEERAIKELRKISDLSKFSFNKDDVFEELYFCALSIGDDKFMKAYEQDANRIFSKEERPQTFRVHAVYRIKNGEVDWAKLILKSGIEFCSTYPIKGLAKAEKRCMELMLKNL